MKTSGLSTALLVMSIAFPGVAMSAATGGGSKEESAPQRPIIDAIPGARRLPGHETMLDNMRSHLETLDQQENSMRNARQRQRTAPIDRGETDENTGNSGPSTEDRNARERQAMRKALQALPSDVLAGAAGEDSRDVILRVVCRAEEGVQSSLEGSDALSDVRDVLCPPD